MPIEVRCPNPNCDQVHQVKSKYGGMRGRCPDCGGWMLIPRKRTASAPASKPRPEAATPDALAETTAWANSGEEIAQRRQKEGTRDKQPTRKVPQPEPDQEAVEDEEAEVPLPPQPYFSYLALLFLFLAILALGAVAGVLAPLVEQPSLQLTGELSSVSHIAIVKLGFTEEGQPWLIGVSAAASGLAFLTFFLSLVRRRFGLLAIFLAILALLAAWCLLVLTGDAFRNRLDQAERLKKEAQVWLAAHPGTTGELSVDWGQSLFLGAGCSAAGFLLLSLALLLMHQRRASRLLFFLLAGLLIAAAGVVLFAGELGFQFSLPFTV